MTDSFRERYERENFILPFWSRSAETERFPRPIGHDLLAWMNFYLSAEVLDLESKHTQRAKKLDLDKFLFFFDRTFPGRDVRMWDIVTTASFLRALREEYASASVYRTFATLTNFAQFLIDHEVFPPVKHPTRGVGKNVLPKRQLQPADGVRAEIRTSRGYSKEYFASSDEMFDTYLQAGEKEFLTGSSRRSLPYRDIAIVSMLYHSGLSGYGIMQPQGLPDTSWPEKRRRVVLQSPLQREPGKKRLCAGRSI